MHSVRNTLLILFAILIDLLQAGVSAGLFFMGAFPGTVGGATGGCILGAKFAGALGCSIGGAVAGVAGTALNGAAAATLPFAIGLGFAVNFCVSITFGAVLMLWLWSMDMSYKDIGLGGFLVEMIPGLDNIPGWTTMVILCIVRKTAEEKLLSVPAESAFKTLFVTAGAGAMGAFKINQGTQALARARGVYTQEQQDARQEEKKQFVSAELRNINGIRMRSRPTPSQPTSVVPTQAISYGS